MSPKYAGLSFEEQQQIDALLEQFDPSLQNALTTLFGGVTREKILGLSDQEFDVGVLTQDQAAEIAAGGAESETEEWSASFGLNREQITALSHPLSAGRPLLILAGAGSGKTAVLTRRVALLLLAGISIEQIFVSTFTVKAAGEMKERVGKLILELARIAPPALKPRLDDILRQFPRAWIGTFHSLCLRLLREKSDDGFLPIEELGFPPVFSILPDGDGKKLLKEISESLPQPPDLRELGAAIDLAANELLTPEAVAGKKSYGGIPGDCMAEAWSKYMDAKRSKGLVDFTDLLYLAATAFADRRMCAQRWKNRFTHILIDEYQDTNVAQYAIATELAAARKNLFVVGDDDQSIYRFRGADVRNIRTFTKDYPDARVVRLFRNYRSTPIILGAANAVLANRPEQPTDKTLLASAPPGAKMPEKIIQYEAADERDEMDFVVFQIRELLGEKFEPSDIVIFYRVHELSGTVSAALRSADIPYVEAGGRSLMNHDIVKSLVALFRSVNVLSLKREGQFDFIRDALVLQDALRDIWKLGALGPPNHADRNMLLSLPEPDRVLLDEQGYVETVQACQGGETQRHLEQLWRGLHGASQSLDSLTPQGLSSFLIDHFGLSAAASENAEIRKGLVVFKKFLSSRLPFAPPGRAGLDQMLAMFHAAEHGEPTADLLPESAVRLLTIHASKGLEFPIVIVIGVEEDILPFVRPGGDRDESAEDRLEQEEEELRLFYVAVTRAKQRLILTCAARRTWYGKETSHRPSRFLEKLPKELVTRGSALSPIDHAAHRTRQFFKDLFGA